MTSTEYSASLIPVSERSSDTALKPALAQQWKSAKMVLERRGEECRWGKTSSGKIRGDAFHVRKH
jgi:hypothetical protein